ncbi:MAG TPA: tetratricopeptide repeat protein [Terracidiphilus sp.]|nr:tetratricopeptide repeat protein [Terracidiphilus sp.]
MLRLPIAVFSGAVLAGVAFLGPAAGAQLPAQRPSSPGASPASTAANLPSEPNSDAQTELQTGSRLTRQGFLEQAIPHLLAARRQGLAPYATAVNLGICYLGTHQYKDAVSILQELVATDHATASVYNLLAQAYLGNRQRQEAWQSFLRAAAATPKDEKLYDYLADACTDQGDFVLGLSIVTRGLDALPDSARLHYERALFLAQLGNLEQARPEFERAAALAPSDDIGYLAKVQLALYGDQYALAETILHEAIEAGHNDFRMLSLLGTVLLREGAAPGDPKFAEAQAALEKSARENANYPAAQIALGKVYLMQDKPRLALAHLEAGRRLEPNNPAVYVSLASTWQKLGNREKAAAMRRQLARLIAQKTANASPAKP